jgi:hypothetical protein
MSPFYVAKTVVITQLYSFYQPAAGFLVRNKDLKKVKTKKNLLIGWKRMRVGILIGIVFVLQVHLIPDAKDNCRVAEERSYLFFTFYQAADVVYSGKIGQLR